MEGRGALVVAALALAAGFSAGGSAKEADFCREDAFGGAHEKAETYARRSGGYCDGAIYQENAGEGDLPVIGVSVAPIKGNPKSGAVGITAIPLPKGLKGIDWPLRLQGVARSPQVNYRLDAALFSGRPLTVGPESAMSKIKPNLRAEDVAWSAWSDSSPDGRTYVSLLMPNAAAGGVEITVRPTIPFAYVVFSIRDTSGNVLQKKTSVNVDDIRDKRGAPVTFAIPAGKPELVVVQVTAIGNSSKTQVARVRLVRPGGTGR